MVDEFVPFETTASFTSLEFTRLLTDFRDMLVEINDNSVIPEPSIRHLDQEAFERIGIKELVSRLDGSDSPPTSTTYNAPISK